MRHRVAGLAVLLLSVFTAFGQGKAQLYVDKVAREEPLRGAVLGALAVKANGDTVLCHNHLQKCLPASNAKLITTGVALLTLGSDYEYKTSLAYSGSIDDGVLNGDLYIVGGGDPTLFSRDSIAVPDEKLLSLWAGLISKAGISSINGLVVGDGRYFDGPIEHGSWAYDDLGTYYGAGGDGLCFYLNEQDISVSAGVAVGDPVKVSVGYPSTPWMSWSQTCVTSKAGTGDELYLYNTDLAPVAEMRGTFAIDRKPKTEKCSNKFGALTCAYYLDNYLNAKGISTEGYADIDHSGHIRKGFVSGAPAASELTEIGSTSSPSLKRIAYVTNRRSDNFYAETLMRTVVKESLGTACYDSLAVAYGKVFRDLGLDPRGIHIVDGSGLSRKNWISPDFFVSFLGAMLGSPVAKDYLEVLGSPVDGAYPSMLSGEPDEIRRRVRMKSGTVAGTRCFSGYILPSPGKPDDETIRFSILINNCPVPSSVLSSIISRIIALAAQENQ